MKKTFIAANCFLLLLLLGSGLTLADEAGQINHGSDGVADTDRVANILQVTKNDDYDRVQCWGAYPWSADGKWIVYQAGRKDSEEICIMNADGTQGECLTDNTVCDSHPGFTPDGRKIVYQHVIAYTGKPEIWIMDVDGANKTSLTAVHGAVAGEQKPVVSPDGTKIAYRHQSTIWVMDIDGTGPGDIPMPVRVSGGSNGSTKHTWSPDSSWVLFNGSPGYLGEEIDDCTEGQRIHKVKPDGSELTKLSDDNLDLALSDEETYTAEKKCENWAFWSPDGNWIAYHANYDDGYTTLSIMKPDGTEKKHLVVAGDDHPVELVPHDTIPGAKMLKPVDMVVTATLENGDQWNWVCGPKSWSPDSSWIAFKMNNTDGSTNIFAYNINTDEVVQLTKDYDDRRLWWSPDGGKILFRDSSWSGRDGGTLYDDLLVLNLAPGFLTYSTVLGAEVDHFEEDGDLEDAVNGVAADVTTDPAATDPGTIMITKLSENPTGFGFDGEYYDLFVSDPCARITGVVFYLAYTGTNPGAPYWSDGTAWVECSDWQVGADPLSQEFIDAGYTGYIEITINDGTTPSLADLSGTAFALGEVVEPEPEPAPPVPDSNSNSPACFINTLVGQ